MGRSFFATPRRLLQALLAIACLAFTPAPEVEAASPSESSAVSTPDKEPTLKRAPRKRRSYRRTRRRRSRRPVKRAPAAAKPPAKTASEAAPPAAPAPIVATELESFSRNVEVQSADGGAWSAAKSRMKLSPDDEIRTGSRSMARVKMADGTKVLLLPNSHAEMENLSTVERTIKLLRGRVRAIVSKMGGNNRFLIKTPVGVASVRGTDFEVSLDDGGAEMSVAVREGQVGVARLGDLSNEIVLNPGERIKFGIEGEMSNPVKSGALPTDREEIRAEVMDSKAKDAILSMAAEELRNADYQVGKSLIDVDGRRVRVEEYITRPAANQFKLVVLNERETRFDYFTYKGTFNQDLPADLAIALRQTGGQFGTAPDYYLTEYETLASNTIDSITDSASGGHLVKITFNGTKYVLDDGGNGTNTREVDAAALQADGSYKVYNPARDTFSIVSAANRDEALKVSVFDSATGEYRNFSSGDNLWKTRFNTYSSFINGTLKTAFAKKTGVTNTLAVDLDATFSNAPVVTISETPSGSDQLHNRLSLYYSDGSKTVYDTYIIDDEGQIADTSVFSGFSSNADYRNELEKWNYQQKVTATEMEGRSIDLVVDPRIGTISGLIQ